MIDITDTSFLSDDGARFSFCDISLPEKILNNMQDIIDKNGFATVNDFRNITNDFSYFINNGDKYGWSDIDDFFIKYIYTHTGTEYQLVVPKASYYKNNYNSRMSPERFKELLDELDGNSLQTLKEKNARYATNGDCLHNFRSGAEVAGGTPAQACWGYMTKHLVALRDKVEKNDFSDREDFLEKCQDTINYIRFLWCIGNDELDKNKEKESK